MQFKDMSDKELVDMVAGLHDCIYVAECYGVKDMVNFQNAEAELDKRGIAMDEVTSLVFTKDGEDIKKYDKKGNAVTL